MRNPHGSSWKVTALLVAVASIGCGGETGERTISSDCSSCISGIIEEADQANAIVAAELGGSYGTRVEPMASLSGPVTSAQVKLFRFQVVKGEAFAVVMRRSDGSQLDPAMGLYEQVEGGALLLAKATRAQGLLPMAAEADAVIIYTAQDDATLVVAAMDQTLAVSGAFQLDLVPLVNAPGSSLNVISTALTIVNDDLREQEAKVQWSFDLGLVAEGAEGWLQIEDSATQTLLDLGYTLADRQDLTVLAAEVNQIRKVLFQELVAAESGQSAFEVSSDQFPPASRAACAELWTQLRSPQHQLLTSE